MLPTSLTQPRAQMDADSFLDGFGNNPDYLLQNFNFRTKSGLVIKINEPDYRAASFLDERVFTPTTQGVWFPLDQLCEVAAASPDAGMPRYIAHVGHCGSTLISRLLAELPGNLPVREPIALLSLALVRRNLDLPTAWIDATQWQRYYELATRALARTYRPGEHALIKLTSTAGNLVPVLTSTAHAPPQMVLIYIRLEPLLAVMLRTPDMRDSVHAYSTSWLTDFHRLTGRTDIRLSELDDAQQVVIKWLTLMLLFVQAQSAYPSEVRMLDFEDFLQDPARELGVIAAHFGLAATPVRIRDLANGPLMHSYSKIPAQTFSLSQRTRELQESRSRYAGEIASGLRWAEELCSSTSGLNVLSGLLT